MQLRLDLLYTVKIRTNLASEAVWEPVEDVYMDWIHSQQLESWRRQTAAPTEASISSSSDAYSASDTVIYTIPTLSWQLHGFYGHCVLMEEKENVSKQDGDERWLSWIILPHHTPSFKFSKESKKTLRLRKNLINTDSMPSMEDQNNIFNILSNSSLYSFSGQHHFGLPRFTHIGSYSSSTEEILINILSVY